MSHGLAAIRWVKRVGGAFIAVGLSLGAYTIVALAQGGPVTPVRDDSQLWAQLVTAGVILSIGIWAIKEFLKFKEEAIKQDRSLQQNLSELNHALMGVQGHGGLLEAARVDQVRRHDLVNQVIRVNERVHDLAVLVGRLCQAAGIDFDDNLLEDP